MSYRHWNIFISARSAGLLKAAIASAFLLFVVPSAPAGATSDPSAIEQEAASLAARWDMDSTRRAVGLYKAAADRRLKQGDFEEFGRASRELARLHLTLGENEPAIAVLREALEAPAGRMPRAEYSNILSALSLAYLKIGDESKSREHYLQALAAARESGDRSAAAYASFAAGEHYYWQYDGGRALEHYSEASRIWKELGETRHLVEALIAISYVSMMRGNASEGLGHAREAEKLARGINGRRAIALSQIAVGHLSSFLNEKQAALESYAQAGAIFPEHLDLQERGALLNGIGSIYESYQEYETSLDYRLKALKAFREDNFVFGQLTTLHSVIGLAYQLDRVSDAEAYVREALKLTNRLNDNYHQSLIYRVIGNHYFGRGEDERARQYYERSLGRTDSVGYKSNAALVNNQLGRIALRGGQPVTARRHFEAAFTMGVEVENFFVQSESLYHLSLLEKMSGDNERALDLARRSVELVETLYADVDSSKLKGGYFSGVYERYQYYTHLLMRASVGQSNGDFALQAFRIAENGRARSLREGLSLAAREFLRDAPRELVRREEELRKLLNNKTDHLSGLLARNAPNEEREAARAEIGKLVHELEEIRTQLKRQSPIYSAIKNPAPLELAELQEEVIDENSVLLEFSLGREGSYLWVIGKRTFDAYVLPPRHELEARVEKLRAAFLQNSIGQGETVEAFQKRAGEAQDVYKNEARALSSELLGQAAVKLAGKRLIVVADGKLQYFPIGALPFPDSASDDPILLTNEVAYEPSAAALMVMRKIGAAAGEQKMDLLLVSDPVFSRGDQRLPGNSGTAPGFAASLLGTFRSFESLDSLAPLPGSRDEASAISDVVGGSAMTSRSGFGANRDEVLGAGLGDYRVLHFATHGLVDERRPELSGIVLSLFNEAGEPQSGGFIRLQDVYGMNLNADLVVLSACDTGLGKEIKGEGLLSLNNAFLQAGARSVVSSLWKADDVATRELMTEFYRGMAAEGLTASEALRRAQMKLRADPRFASPLYWAAFTLHGDYASAPKFSRSRTKWLYAAPAGAILAAVLILAAVRRRRIRSS